MTSKFPRIISLGALAALLVGCNMTGAMAPVDAFPTGSAAKVGKGPAVYSAPSDAGTRVDPSADPTKLPKLVAMRNMAGAFGQVRSDPFALTADEKTFETNQTTERFFGSNGFSVMVTPKEEVDEALQPVEPQPYRRLSGIVVGDSVLAIFEEEGKSPVIVTPGMMIPNSPWRVVSIDQDKAVLRRAGNTKPNQIVVRLEQPRFAPAATGNQGGSGSFPGGPPPGSFPGNGSGPRGGAGAPGGVRGD